jgi:hypothetical protein
LKLEGENFVIAPNQTGYLPHGFTDKLIMKKSLDTVAGRHHRHRRAGYLREIPSASHRADFVERVELRQSFGLNVAAVSNAIMTGSEWERLPP